MKRRKWWTGIWSVLLCVMMVLTGPVGASAASKADRSAYRSVFDASYYYSAYPDVAAACGKNNEALFNHFVNYGVKEGRSASAEFNPQAYRQRYEDLQEAFGSYMASYCRHYETCGRKEGRNGRADGQPVAVADTSQQTDQSTDAQNAQQANGNVIGTYTTAYVAGIPRANNVELAASRINGVVVQPGQSFSFSATILPRSRANGYVVAPIFVSGKKSTGIGGGVCQVSSTLYAAMVTAGLPATERHPHSLPVDYLPKGLDATIAGNYLDLKFTNVYSQPLQIQASASNGTLTVSLVLQ